MSFLQINKCDSKLVNSGVFLSVHSTVSFKLFNNRIQLFYQHLNTRHTKKRIKYKKEYMSQTLNSCFLHRTSIASIRQHSAVCVPRSLFFCIIHLTDLLWLLQIPLCPASMELLAGSLKSWAQPADCWWIQWCGIVSHQIHDEGLCGCIYVVMGLWCALKVRSVPQVNGQGLLSTYNATGSLSLAFFCSLTSASKQARAPRERERYC